MRHLTKASTMTFFFSLVKNCSGFESIVRSLESYFLTLLIKGIIKYIPGS